MKWVTTPRYKKYLLNIVYGPNPHSLATSPNQNPTNKILLNFLWSKTLEESFQHKKLVFFYLELVMAFDCVI